MGRQYIGIEQMDYIETIACKRMEKVIAGEQGGISNAVNWKGGGDFIYVELAAWNEKAKKKIEDATSLDELKHFFEDMRDKYFLHYKVSLNEFEDVVKEKPFQQLPLAAQKRMFLAMLDLNQLYVQRSEAQDAQFGIPEKDQALTAAFYNNHWLLWRK